MNVKIGYNYDIGKSFVEKLSTEAFFCIKLRLLLLIVPSLSIRDLMKCHRPP